METFLEYKTPLGEILVKRGLITPAQLRHALTIQERDGARLGDILIGEGMIGYYDLYRAVARSHGLPFVDLLKAPPQADLLNSADFETYLQRRIIPWRTDGTHIHVAVCEVTLETMVWIRQWFGVGTKLVITSPLDISRSVEHLFGPDIEKASCLSLWHQLPDVSARITMTARQTKCIIALAAAIGLCAITEPIATVLGLILFCHVAYSVTMLFKFFIFIAGLSRPRLPPPDSQSSHDLPVYSILIPMYREATSLAGMLQCMAQLDYPPSKLDIKCLVPEYDGILYDHIRRDKLWDRYYTNAPARQRHCVEQSKIVKRA